MKCAALKAAGRPRLCWILFKKDGTKSGLLPPHHHHPAVLMWVAEIRHIITFLRALRARAALPY